MPVIEFVNHIELLAVDYGKVWRGENVSLALLFGRNVSTPFKWLRYLASPRAIGERIRFFSLSLPSQRKHPRPLSSKIPRNLKA